MALHIRKIIKNVQSTTMQGLFSGLRKRRRPIFIIFMTAIAVILVSAGIFYYQRDIAPFRQPVVQIDGKIIRMSYFLKRVKMVGGNSDETMQQLIYEEIVKETAPKHGIEVSQSEVEQALRNHAMSATASTQGTIEMTDSTFEEWYTNQLETTDLSDAEYREIVRVNILAARLQDYLADGIPSTAEQVHLNVMALSTFADAEQAKARIDAGEIFSNVASELSVDELSKSNGGDLGWIPRGVIPYDNVVFNLEKGQISNPIMIDPDSPSTSGYALFLVKERDSDRIIEPYLKQLLSYRAFYNWLAQEVPKHQIEYDYGSDIQAWVNKQLSSNQR